MSDWRNYVDEVELRKTIGILKPNGQLFEVRVMGEGKKPLSGYFKSADQLIKAFDKISLAGQNVYITLHRLKEACYNRHQRDAFKAGATATTDTDVERMEWFFIDVDPVRLSGISSSREELKAAKDVWIQVHNYLKDIGFSEPVSAASGNGYHLLYRIDLDCSPESIKLIENGLKVLSNLFSNDMAKVDVVNKNPSRICKLYGTMAQKGANSEERPHRMSKILRAETEITGREFLEKLSADFFQDPEPTGRAYERFDLQNWMAEHGIKVYREHPGNDCQIYELEECPFDHSHQRGDSKIFHYSNGAIAFKCHHNSCQQYKWPDVRKLFDPDVYDHIDDGHIDDGYAQYRANRLKRKDEDYVELTGTEEQLNEPMFFTPSMIDALPDEKDEYILSGCTEVDEKLGGLRKKAISILSGLRSSAKSTWLNQVVLTAIEHKNSVILYSGEFEVKKAWQWICLNAAGNENLPGERPGFYFTPKVIRQKIREWADPYLNIYNNRYGNNFKAMQTILMRQIRETRADLVILDNLMTLDIRDMNPADKYAAQSAFVQSLKRMAMQTNTHIIFVAHPRKTVGFLRLEDISGSGDLVNAVDNAFIIHRRNKDFEDRYKEFSRTTLEACDNVVEICKDRENGTQDYFVPLWFDPKSKRLRNSPAEYITYGWRTEDVSEQVRLSDEGFLDADDDMNPFLGE